MKKVRSDKFKTGKEEYIDKDIKWEETREITIGRLPVMVKSDLCWMSEAEKGDCEFDHGGYFLIKGAEKVSYNYDLFIRVSVLFVTDFVHFRVTYVFSDFCPCKIHNCSCLVPAWGLLLVNFSPFFALGTKITCSLFSVIQWQLWRLLVADFDLADVVNGGQYCRFFCHKCAIKWSKLLKFGSPPQYAIDNTAFVKCFQNRD